MRAPWRGALRPTRLEMVRRHACPARERRRQAGGKERSRRQCPQQVCPQQARPRQLSALPGPPRGARVSSRLLRQPSAERHTGLQPPATGQAPSPEAHGRQGTGPRGPRRRTGRWRPGPLRLRPPRTRWQQQLHSFDPLPPLQLISKLSTNGQQAYYLNWMLQAWRGGKTVTRRAYCRRSRAVRSRLTEPPRFHSVASRSSSARGSSGTGFSSAPACSGLGRSRSRTSLTTAGATER